MCKIVISPAASLMNSNIFLYYLLFLCVFGLYLNVNKIFVSFKYLVFYLGCTFYCMNNLMYFFKLLVRYFLNLLVETVVVFQSHQTEGHRIVKHVKLTQSNCLYLHLNDSPNVKKS